MSEEVRDTHTHTQIIEPYLWAHIVFFPAWNTRHHLHEAAVVVSRHQLAHAEVNDLAVPGVAASLDLMAGSE